VARAKPVNPKVGDDVTEHHLASGVGASAGAATGAVIGSMAGPVGMAAGAAIGGVAGEWQAAERAKVANPKSGDDLGNHNLGTGVGPAAAPWQARRWARSRTSGNESPVQRSARPPVAPAGKAIALRGEPEGRGQRTGRRLQRRAYYSAGRSYDYYAPAYRLGYEGWSRYGGLYDEYEPRLATEWESVKGRSRLTWEEAKLASRAAWDRVERAIPGDFDRDGK
jgi:hypothetical protein